MYFGLAVAWRFRQGCCNFDAWDKVVNKEARYQKHG